MKSSLSSHLVAAAAAAAAQSSAASKFPSAGLLQGKTNSQFENSSDFLEKFKFPALFCLRFAGRIEHGQWRWH
jgi:hypothetical protein